MAKRAAAAKSIPNFDIFEPITNAKPKTKNVRGIRNSVNVGFTPKNLSQARLLKAIRDEANHIICATGPAGTGKTYLIAKYAMQELVNGNIKKIVITRPTVSTGEGIGFLPGGLDEKMMPWLLPIYDAFGECDGVNKAELRNMEAQGVIEIAPLQFMRGRSLQNCIIIADEMQNAEAEQVKMLLTRIGEGSKILITGDLEQTDKLRNNGLADFMKRIGNKEVAGIHIHKFERADIVRHPIIDKILDLYE